MELPRASCNVPVAALDQHVDGWEQVGGRSKPLSACCAMHFISSAGGTSYRRMQRVSSLHGALSVGTFLFLTNFLCVLCARPSREACMSVSTGLAPPSVYSVIPSLHSCDLWEWCAVRAIFHISRIERIGPMVPLCVGGEYF